VGGCEKKIAGKIISSPYLDRYTPENIDELQRSIDNLYKLLFGYGNKFLTAFEKSKKIPGHSQIAGVNIN